jgi:hypothetical protein
VWRCSSWLNQIERWFARITRKRIRRGTFRSVRELTKAIHDYIRIQQRSAAISVGRQREPNHPKSCKISKIRERRLGEVLWVVCPSQWRPPITPHGHFVGLFDVVWIVIY